MNGNTSTDHSKLDTSVHKILNSSLSLEKAKKKEGLLYKRSDHLKQWRKRYCSCENNFLKIAHDSTGKNLTIIDLNNYTPSWQGKTKSKYVFIFKVRPELKIKPKTIILSSSDEGLAKDWFKFFLSVMVYIFNPIVPFILTSLKDISALLSGQTHIINEIGSRARSHSHERRNDDISGLDLSQSPTKLEEQFPEIQNSSKRRSISVGAKNKKLAEEQVLSQNSITPSDVSSMELMDSAMNLTLTENATISNRISESGSNFGTSQFLSERLSEVANKISVGKKNARQSLKLVEFVLPKEAPKWVEELFEKYIKGKEMWKAPTEEKIDRDEWSIIQDNGQFRIMQSEKKSRVFKCLYSLENGASAEKLLQVRKNTL